MAPIKELLGETLLVFPQELMKRVKKQIVEASMAIPQARAHLHIAEVLVMEPIQKQIWGDHHGVSTRAHEAGQETNCGGQHGDSTSTGASSHCRGSGRGTEPETNLERPSWCFHKSAWSGSKNKWWRTAWWNHAGSVVIARRPGALESSGGDGMKAVTMFSAALNVSAEFRPWAYAGTSVQARASNGTRARLHTAGRSFISTLLSGIML